MAVSQKKPVDDWKDRYFKTLNELDELARSWSEQVERVSRDLLRVLERFRGKGANVDSALDAIKGYRSVTDDDAQSALRQLVITIMETSFSTDTLHDVKQTPAPPRLEAAECLRRLVDKVTFPSCVATAAANLRTGLVHVQSLKLEIEQVEALAAELSDLFTFSAANRVSDARDALQLLIDRLTLPADAHPRVNDLTVKLQAATDAHAVADVAALVAELVTVHMAELQAEIVELNAFLVSIKSRLNEMQARISADQGRNADAASDRRNLDHAVAKSLTTMRQQVADADDLARLKIDIPAQIAVIDANVGDYLKAESNRAERALSASHAFAEHLVGLERHAEQLRKALVKARTSALRDALTGLPNRMAYDGRLTSEIGRWQREGTPLSLVIVDIDEFKLINDTYGHQAGDRVLKYLARELEGQVRAQDFFARYGGEEFVLILPNTDAEGAMRLSETLRAHIESCHFKHGGRPVVVTVSGGVATFATGETKEEVFSRADASLYAAKAGGRNQCQALNRVAARANA